MEMDLAATLQTINWSSLQTVADMERVLKTLREARKMLPRRDQNQNQPGSTNGPLSLSSMRTFRLEPLEGEELIDFAIINSVDNDPEQWLKPTSFVNGRARVPIEEVEKDDSHLDLDLRKVQNSLVNEIKSILFEETTSAILEESNRRLSSSSANSSVLSSPFKTASPRTPQMPPPNNYGTYRIPHASVLSPTPSRFPKGRDHDRPRDVQKISSVESNGSEDSEFSEPLVFKAPAGVPYASTPLVRRLAQLDISDVEVDDEYDDNLNQNQNMRDFLSPREIDSRTYTRPKKQRAPLSLDDDLASAMSSLTFKKGNKSNRGTNLNLTNDHEIEGEDLNQIPNTNGLNTTFAKQSEGNWNNTIDIESKSASRGKQVARNDSYVISKRNEGLNTTYTESTKGLNATYGESKSAMNTTFNTKPSVVTMATLSPNANGNANAGEEALHNLSMEELQSMASKQAQALKDVPTGSRTLTRKGTYGIINGGHANLTFDPRRPPERTSSTDTYSIGASNPESPSGSSASGLSSPLEAQSYANLQDSQLGRSMPNLAMRRGSGTGLQGLGFSLAHPVNSLQFSGRQPHHTSDTRLASLANNAKFSLIPSQKHQGSFSSIGSAGSSQGMGTMPMPRTQGQGPRIAHGVKGGQRPVAAVQSQPRFTSRAPAQTRPSGLRAPGSFLRPPGFSSSRLPGPGTTRTTIRPGRPQTSPGMGKSNADWKEGCY